MRDNEHDDDEEEDEDEDDDGGIDYRVIARLNAPTLQLISICCVSSQFVSRCNNMRTCFDSVITKSRENHNESREIKLYEKFQKRNLISMCARTGVPLFFFSPLSIFYSPIVIL